MHNALEASEVRNARIAREANGERQPLCFAKPFGRIESIQVQDMNGGLAVG